MFHGLILLFLPDRQRKEKQLHRLLFPNLATACVTVSNFTRDFYALKAIPCLIEYVFGGEDAPPGDLLRRFDGRTRLRQAVLNFNHQHFSHMANRLERHRLIANPADHRAVRRFFRILPRINVPSRP